MPNLKAGFAAGFVATVILSLLMIAKAVAGLLSAFNAIADNAHLVSMVSPLPAAMPLGWLLHFIIGTILWGAIYAWLRPRLPASDILAGIAYGILAWLAMMIVFMPIVGHGFFALSIGLPAAVATLVLHVIYGAVLGYAYAQFAQRLATI